ncbi:peptide methionine sulfoxide [Pseudomassariella vexata]|uniref:peptide-methionine (S)-S-oxide reductase n=1 Tax=Pseudomassariella vexata TaxID=1141098 RepID=A0A1Y2DF73_9PEZI|nr:peptide methionine sulfoxide [Pseudomassariella vexata]ORY57837.1 peptide methionine sulfoxide [Pseudomassariella vexata]
MRNSILRFLSDTKPIVIYLSTAAVAIAIAMVFQYGFFSRLFRPLTSSTRLGISVDTASGFPASVPEGAERCTVAAGCFWGVEHLYRKHFGGNGLYDAKVGYIGGDTRNPTYRAVCSGSTGYAEAAQIIFDPTKITYKQLVEFFYKIHDPTTKDAQGPDRGSQYRSGIYTHGEEQARIALEVTEKVNQQWWNGKVVTEVIPAGQWWDAETYHQLYLDKNPGGYECPSHRLRNFPPLQ